MPVCGSGRCVTSTQQPEMVMTLGAQPALAPACLPGSLAGLAGGKRAPGLHASQFAGLESPYLGTLRQVGKLASLRFGLGPGQVRK